MRVIDTLRIDPKNRVCVLAYGDRRLLLGISPSAITLLDSQDQTLQKFQANQPNPRLINLHLSSSSERC